MKENIEKSIFTAVATIIFSRIGIVIIPIALLLVAFIVDYITGVMAAKYRNMTISSEIGKKGIIKKLAMSTVIVACLMVDILIIYGCVVSGITIAFYFIVTTLVSVLMFLNEIVSILENVKDMGVNLPKWLLPFIKNIRSKVEQKTETEVSNLIKKKEE